MGRYPLLEKKPFDSVFSSKAGGFYFLISVHAGYHNVVWRFSNRKWHDVDGDLEPLVC